MAKQCLSQIHYHYHFDSKNSYRRKSIKYTDALQLKHAIPEINDNIRFYNT